MQSLGTITVALPCRNEQDNIEKMVQSIERQFEEHLPMYQYYIQFMDNSSTDNTRAILRRLTLSDPHVRAIFNVVSFSGSAFHGILQAEGDCCIYMASDFQEPPELIPQLVHAWEQGAKVVCAIKTSSEESHIMWGIRSIYYHLIDKLSSINQIEHFTGFGLYDRDFIEIIRSLHDPTPTLRGLVAEYGYSVVRIPYVQQNRRSGKSSQTILSLFDYSMKNITTYVRSVMHVALLGGLFAFALILMLGIICLPLACLRIIQIPLINLVILFVLLLIGSLQVALTGFVGEYVMSVEERVRMRPYAIEEERMGFSTPAREDNIESYHPSNKGVVGEHSVADDSQ